MLFRKTWFSFLNMTLGAAVFGCLLFVSFVRFFEYKGLTGSLLDGLIPVSYIPSGVLVLIVCALYFLLHFLKTQLSASVNSGENSKSAVTDSEKKFAKKLLTWFSFLFLLALGIYMIYRKCLELMSSGSVVSTIAGFCGNLESPYNYDGDFPKHIYKLLTGFVFNVFGSKPTVYLILGATVFTVSAIFIYLTVNALFGVLPALLSFGSVFAYAYLSTGVCIYSVKENIMFLITTFVIMLMMLLIRLRHDGLMISPANMIMFILLGLLLGFVSSFYPGLLILIIPVIIMLIADDINFSELETEYENPGSFLINRPLLPLFSVVLATLAGFFGFTFFNKMLHGFDIMETVNDFLSKMQLHGFLIPDSDRVLYTVFNRFLFVTVIISVFAIMAFLDLIFSKYDRAGVYLFSALPLCFLYFFTDLYGNAHIMILALAVAIAACGLRILMVSEPVPVTVSEGVETGDEDNTKKAKKEKKEKKRRKAGEETNDSTIEEGGEDTKKETVEILMDSEDIPGITEPEPGSDAGIEPKSESGAATKTGSEAVPDTTSKDKVTLYIEENEANDIMKNAIPAFFENPVPMPKKHEKKVINYDFDVPDYLMKYDIEIDPDDDFDI